MAMYTTASRRIAASVVASSESILGSPMLTMRRSYSLSNVLFAKAKTGKTEEGDGVVWKAKKVAAKENRRATWEAHQNRIERVKDRRKGATRFRNRDIFRSFYVPEKMHNELMNRKARQAGLDWQNQVAVVLERGNVVMEDLEDWEEEYENLRDYMWQFGKEYPEELHMKTDTTVVSNEDLMALLPEGFTPAPRETEADFSGNVKTIDRKLKTKIYLMVKERGEADWKFPTVAINEEEMLLDAAKRALKEQVGSNVEFWCPSNCPVAVKMAAFPKEQQKSSGLYGTKTFFMRVQYDEGDVVELGIEDFAWLDREEIVARFPQKGKDDRSSQFYHYLL